MFGNPRRGRQARNFTTNAPKILDLKSSSEQIFSRKLPLGAPVKLVILCVLLQSKRPLKLLNVEVVIFKRRCPLKCCQGINSKFKSEETSKKKEKQLPLKVQMFSPFCYQGATNHTIAILMTLLQGRYVWYTTCTVEPLCCQGMRDRTGLPGSTAGSIPLF